MEPPSNRVSSPVYSWAHFGGFDFGILQGILVRVVERGAMRNDYWSGFLT